MTFAAAVAAAPPEVADAYREGLLALGSHSKRVKCQHPGSLKGSVHLDAALAAAMPDDPRWDYGVGVRSGSGERAVWIEVHPASTRNVSEVIAKLKWLREWLRTFAQELDDLTDRSRESFFWVATSGVHIPRHSPQARRLRQAGLPMPKRFIVLC